MMQRCNSSSHGHVMGGCSCGMYHTQSNSFSMLFSMSTGHRAFDEGEMYSFTTASSPSSSVDCTLSLGTPSTRLSGDQTGQQFHHHEKKRSSCMSNFGWNILPSKHAPPPSSAKSHRGGNNVNAASAASGDPLLARRCANCDTTSTPLWRNGPRGPKSLCNACGIRFKKEERRATASAATGNGGAAHGGFDTQQMMNSSWVPPQKIPCYSSAYGNEYRFIDDDDHRDSETGVPFMSWRFNVTDRPTSLVHDFTR